MSHRPMPGAAAPALSVPRAGGGSFDLSTTTIDTFLIVDFYRGMHCTRCRQHLSDLGAKLPHFNRRGVSAVAVSMDPQDRATAAKETWHVGDLDVGYGLSMETAQAWGLFLSQSITDRETAVFSEPATFLIAPDRSIYAIIQNSTPFARFHFADLLEAVDTIAARSYPPRGTYVP